MNQRSELQLPEGMQITGPIKAGYESILTFDALALVAKLHRALVSHGETQPLVPSPGPEQANRRAETAVSGFVQNHPTVMNGKYAEIVWRTLVNRASTESLAERPHPQSAIIETQVTATK